MRKPGMRKMMAESWRHQEELAKYKAAMARKGR